MHNARPSQDTQRRTRRRTCVHGLLICTLLRSPLAAADVSAGLGLSAASLPDDATLWDCSANGCFTNGCPGNEELWTTNSDVFWWDDLSEYEQWNNSCARDYDYDVQDPDKLTTSACTWLSDCTDAGEAACENKCIVNVFQDFNDDAAAVPGQQTRLGDLIARNQDMIAANGCALLAGLIGTCDSGPSALGLSPADETALFDAGIQLVANMPCPSESDVDCAMDLLNQIRDEYADLGAPYNTPADRDAWPFAYVPTREGELAVASTFKFIGGAEEAKRYLKQNCMTGVLSANYLTYFEFSGLKIDQEISESDYALSDPGSAAVMCRDNARVLENQLKRSLVRQADKERLDAIRSDVLNGQCLNENELVHLDFDVRSTEGFIASSMFGVGAGPASRSKHCQQELLNGMRELHEGCGQITTREECIAKRFPPLQKSIASLRNTMITGVAGDDISADCLAAEEEPSEYVTCPSGNAPNGGVMSPGGAASPEGPPAQPAQPAQPTQPATNSAGEPATPAVAAPASSDAAAAALGPWAVAAVCMVAAALVA